MYISCVKHRARSYYSFIFSVFLHIIFFLYLGSDNKNHTINRINEKKSAIKWIKIPPKKNKPKPQFNTVGAKSGEKNLIAAKTMPAKQEQLSLDQLKMASSLKDFPQKNTEKKEIKKNTHAYKKYWEPSKSKNIQGLKDAPKALSDLLKSGPGLRLQYKIPKGLKIDQLNQLELKFYGFHQRVAESYLQAFIKAYHEMKRQYPYTDLNKIPDDMISYRVTFNQDGKKDRLIPLKQGDSAYFQEFFIKTMGHLSIPNPPIELLEDFQLELVFTLYKQRI